MPFNPSANQIHLLSIFQIFRKPLSYELVARLSRLSIPRIRELIEPLVKRNWLIDKGGYLALGSDLPSTIDKSTTNLNKEERIEHLLQMVRPQKSSDQIDILSVLELLWKMGEVEDTTLLSWESIRADVRAQRYRCALDTSFWIASRIDVIVQHTNLWASLISIILFYDSLADMYKKYPAETVKTLELGKDLCKRLGDERCLALVLLHLGRGYTHFHQIQKSFEYFRGGFEIVERLGDRDIEGQALPFYIYYYTVQGQSQKALISFEQINHEERPEIDMVPDPQVAATTGLQAAQAGEFHFAIGLFNAKWRRAVMEGNNGLANFYRAYLGQVLMMYGLSEDAIFHLDAVLEETNAHEDGFVYFFTLRAKAYYLFQTGRISESYDMLRGAVELSSPGGWHRPFYGFPWLLEMLYYFHRAQYPPVPYYEFPAEMEHALAAPNIQLRAVALRIRADEASKSGERQEIIRDFLLISEKYLMEAGNPSELAKTRSQLALLYHHQGDFTRARQLARQAWGSRNSMGAQRLPPEIYSLVGDLTVTAQEISDGFDVLVRFLDMIDALITSDNLQVMFHNMITTTTRFFRAERGAIFMLEGNPANQRLVFNQGCNLSARDIEESDLLVCRQQAIKVINSNQPLIIREPVAGDALQMQGVKSVLCIPLFISDTEKGIFYYDTLHVSSAFDWCDDATLSRIAESIRMYIRRSVAYTQLLDRQKSRTIPVVTETSEQESGVFVTSGRLFQNVLQRADRASLSDAPVLILGETGVGKEVIARRVHHMSRRRDMPFIAVNLASIPETLLESELFGHEKGAFTGADRQKLGRMELANKGTLFIDEVGDIPKFVQVKLLRALEEMSFVRIGGVVKRDVDFRLIAATNRDLNSEVEAGNFRADLFYRLNVIPIFIPPLRERGDDAVELAQKFLEQSSRKYRLPVQPLSLEAKEWIRTYHWPGNVRELRNVMERAVILNSTPDKPSNPMLEILPTGNHDQQATPEDLTMDEVQRRAITRVLNKTNHNVSRAAVILGMKRNTLCKRMQKLGLQ